MAERKTLTFALMDAPYESARMTTALRLIDIAARRGCAVNGFAYEGAVLLPFSRQQPHPNADRSFTYWLEERPALTLSFWVGRQWRRISTWRRQWAQDRTGGPLGYRWCDATERHI